MTHIERYQVIPSEIATGTIAKHKVVGSKPITRSSRFASRIQVLFGIKHGLLVTDAQLHRVIDLIKLQ